MWNFFFKYCTFTVLCLVVYLCYSRSWRCTHYYCNSAHISHLIPGEQKRSGDRGPETTPKNLLFKPGQSGLRPPGFSTLPAARLATFGFVRSSSVSSVSSNQSDNSSHNDPCRLSQRESRSHHTLHIKLGYTFLPFYSKCELLKIVPQKILQTWDR